MHLPLRLTALLAAAWWLLSGHTDGLLLGLGAASVVLTVWLSRRMDVVDRESHPLHLSVGLARFWVLLLRDIVISNLQVLRLVFSPRAALSPRIVELPRTPREDLAQVVLANAITLTPGTVTLEIDDRHLVVHALTEAGAADILAGTMAARLPLDVEDEA